MGKAETAKENFCGGMNCAQAVLLAFCEDYGLSPELATRLAAPLGGGLARLREVCGAVSGGALVLGLRYGAELGKKELYEKTQAFAKAFAEEAGSYTCRELLGLAEKASEPTPEPRTDTYYKKRPCAELVALAAALLERDFL